MKNLDNYQDFFAGRYFSEGLRTTAGIIIPTIVMSYFGMLDLGLIIALGAMAVSIVDQPGPIEHRRNGMLIGVALVSLYCLVTTLLVPYPFLMACFILLSGFQLSMLTIYGVRASTLGLACLIILILNLQTVHSHHPWWYNPLFTFIGGLWYALFSISLYTVRPYKAIQQTLGEFVMEISSYMELRSHFYENNPNYDNIYNQLVKKQVSIETHRTLISEMLFRTRTIIKESTNKSRRLLKLYLDVVELYEETMTTYHDYKTIHKNFEETGFLIHIQNMLRNVSLELESIGKAIQTGAQLKPSSANLHQFKILQEEFEALRQKYLNTENIDQFIPLGRIVNNVYGLTERVHQLNYYTNDRARFKPVKDKEELADWNPGHQDIRMQLFWDNLNFSSNIFRHSLRVGFALLIGFLIARMLNLGHGYWILLTIVVILKPAYSLTKQRNKGRLLGTLIGILLGVTCLIFISNSKILIALIIVFMIITYSYVRTNYFISVIPMTAYVILFFNLLFPQSIGVVLVDRAMDTFIGSSVAFAMSLLFVPNWEYKQMRPAIVDLNKTYLELFHFLKNYYFDEVEFDRPKYLVIRKNMLTQLANISDSFSRMLSEPKQVRVGMEFVHRYVVLSQILASHLTTLGFFAGKKYHLSIKNDLRKMIESTEMHFNNIDSELSSNKSNVQSVEKISYKKSTVLLEELMEKRRNEIESGLDVTNTRTELIQQKSIADQYSLIYNLSGEMEKIARDFSNSFSE